MTNILSKAANYIAKNFSPSYATTKTELKTQRTKTSGLEQEVETLKESNLEHTEALRCLEQENTKIQNRTIAQSRNEYRKSVITENPKYTILLDDKGTVRYQGKETIKILGNITTKNISEIFYTQGDEDSQNILDTVLDTKGGYLHVKNNGKDFPIDIEVEQFSIKDNRYEEPFVHTTRIDIHKHGWVALAKKILHMEKHSYQATLIIQADQQHSKESDSSDASP